MDRRSFIAGLIRVGAFVAFDPHRVVFDMAKGFFLPEPGTWGALQRSDWPPTLAGNAHLLDPHDPIIIMHPAQANAYRELFERERSFYEMLKSGGPLKVSTRPLRLPYEDPIVPKPRPA